MAAILNYHLETSYFYTLETYLTEDKHLNTKQKDVELILKLYELRRDEAMRRARAWYITEFNPQSAKEDRKSVV